MRNTAEEHNSSDDRKYEKLDFVGALFEFKQAKKLNNTESFYKFNYAITINRLGNYNKVLKKLDKIIICEKNI